MKRMGLREANCLNRVWYVGETDRRSDHCNNLGRRRPKGIRTMVVKSHVRCMHLAELNCNSKTDPPSCEPSKLVVTKMFLEYYVGSAKAFHHRVAQYTQEEGGGLVEYSDVNCLTML